MLRTVIVRTGNIAHVSGRLLKYFCNILRSI